MGEDDAQKACTAPCGVAIRTSGMGIWQMRASDSVLALNSRSCEIHNVTPDVGQSLSFDRFLELVHVDDRWKVRATLGADPLNGFRDLEYRVADTSEGTHWVLLSGDLQTNSDGSASVLVGSCFDISERMMVSRQILQSQKMEAVGQLTAGIAHNFNNILSAILPSLHLVGPHVKPEGVKLINNAQLAAERATDLVAELMVVAGRKTGQQRKPLDLATVVERVVRICRTTFGGWVQLSLICDFELPPLLGNESQIEQILLNLLLNSRDAFEEAAISCPRIDLELDVEDNQLVLRVVDNGPGMDGKTLQRIFEPFFTTKGAGTGLGLATAYGIVAEHGGSIECFSKPDSGTEFVLCFPVHEGTIEVEAGREAPTFVGGTERILVVDDDVLVRRVTSAALRDAGYDVLEAKGGSEALVTQGSGQIIDLVVLDMVMPEVTGDVVLEAMRATDPQLKVLIFTGLSDSRVDKLTGVEILQKPAGVNELLQAVRGAIDNPIPN